MIDTAQHTLQSGSVASVKIHGRARWDKLGGREREVSSVWRSAGGGKKTVHFSQALALSGRVASAQISRFIDTVRAVNFEQAISPDKPVATQSLNCRLTLWPIG